MTQQLDFVPQVSQRWRVTALTVAGALIAFCVAAALAALVPPRLLIPGLPDAGALTTIGLPAVRAIFDLMTATTIGWIMAAALLAPPQANGLIGPGGYRALRAASLSAMVWAASGFALVPLTLSDTKGEPLQESFDAQAITTAFTVLANLRAPAIAAMVAVVLAIATRIVLRMGWVFVLLGLSLATLLPIALAGHAVQTADHDHAVDSLLLHLGGAVIWVGGLIALVGLMRQRIPRLDIVAQRYSTLALIAFVMVALSGVINASLRMPYFADLWRTDYGRLIVLKTLLLLVLGGMGYLHRRATLPAITKEGTNRGAFLRLAVVETAVMAATLGVAATLGRTATPAPQGIIPTPAEMTLGFDLPGPPSFMNFVFFWRFDLLLGTAALVLAALYIAGVRRLKKRNIEWSKGRTIAWLGGCFTMLVATSSGLGAYGLASFSIHMVQHMVLAMLTPILFALGGPVTLLLRAVKPAAKDEPPGIREATIAFIHSPYSRFLTHPLIVLALFVTSFYALYLTDLFTVMISSHLGHIFMSVHFIITGYLYYWVIIGVDPAPRQLSYPVKIGILFAAMPFHSFFGLAVMSSHHLLGTDFYTRLSAEWVPDLLQDQQFGGAIGWGFTEVPLVIVVMALMTQWARSDGRLAKRKDRREEVTNDAELDAYNAMLAKFAELDRAGSGPA